MDLAILTAAPSTIRVGDREFKIGPFRYLELGMLQRWMNQNRENPAVIGRDPEWSRDLFSDLDGVEFFLTLLFGKYQVLKEGKKAGGDGEPDPEDEGDLVHILRHVGRNDILKLFAVAMEIDPKEDDRPGPKAPARGGRPTTAGSSASSTGRRDGPRKSSPR